MNRSNSTAGSEGRGAEFRHRGVVQLSVTHRCQCNCAHCGVRDLNQPPFGCEPSTTELEAILADIAKAGFGIVDLYGGEPTLRDDLVELVRFGRKRGLEMVLETNALRLDGDYLRALRAAGIGRIYISLDDGDGQHHDATRGRGTFDHAVRGLNLCRDLRINAHSSIVPRDRDFFLSGEMNDYVRFCLDNGADGTRVLFPCPVGGAAERDNPFGAGQDERPLFEAIDPELRDRVYVSSEMATINKILSDTATRCAAKSVFCHVTSNGRFTPCPYLPLVFGDVTRESISEVFERGQDHPLLSKGGGYCPSRDTDYMSSYLVGLSPGQPYVMVESRNRIELSHACDNDCIGCGLEPKARSLDDIRNEVAAVEDGYRSVHLFGGEPFERDDIFAILDAAGERFALHLYTNGRALADAARAERLATYAIASVRIPFFAADEATFDAHTRRPGSYRDTVAGIAALARVGVPVALLVPGRVGDADVEALRAFGVESVNSYWRDGAEPLPDTVACFGRTITRTELVWRRRPGTSGGRVQPGLQRPGTPG